MQLHLIVTAMTQQFQSATHKGPEVISMLREKIDGFGLSNYAHPESMHRLFELKFMPQSPLLASYTIWLDQRKMWDFCPSCPPNRSFTYYRLPPRSLGTEYGSCGQFIGGQIRGIFKATEDPKILMLSVPKKMIPNIRWVIWIPSRGCKPVSWIKIRSVQTLEYKCF